MTGHMLPGESTSAALRRVTAERDEALAKVETLRHSEGADLTITRAELKSARTELALVRRRLETALADLGRANNRAEAAERTRAWAATPTSKEKSMSKTDGGEGGWLRSSFCGTNACVAVLFCGPIVYIRSTSDSGPPVKVTREEWAAFVEGVKAGEFEVPDA